MYVLECKLEANFEASQGECQIIPCGVPFSIKLSGNSTLDDFLENLEKSNFVSRMVQGHRDKRISRWNVFRETIYKFLLMIGVL